MFIKFNYTWEAIQLKIDKYNPIDIYLRTSLFSKRWPNIRVSVVPEFQVRNDFRKQLLWCLYWRKDPALDKTHLNAQRVILIYFLWKSELSTNQQQVPELFRKFWKYLTIVADPPDIIGEFTENFWLPSVTPLVDFLINV